MSIPPFSGAIYSGLLSDPETSALFTDQAMLSAMLEVEAALAEAEAAEGVIPRDAAKAIVAGVRRVLADGDELTAMIGALRQPTVRDGLPVPAMVELMREKVGAEGGGFLHWGATSQDILDTALILQCVKALARIEGLLASVSDRLAGLAEAHRDTVMLARTRYQQATPTSFGLKAAGWLAPLTRHRGRLVELRRRVLVVSFAGASGNLSAVGVAGLEVERRLARRLGLGVSPAAWHTARDGLVELGSWLALVTGSLGKLGLDLVLLSQTEVGEIAFTGAGGSSTMPQKQNPVAAETLVALARFNASRAGELHGAMLQAHERDGIAWAGEWMILPDMMIAAAAALVTADRALSGVVVRTDVMAGRIEANHGLALAEAASFALSLALPRQQAVRLVKEACRRAAAEQRHLRDVLAELAPDGFDGKALARPRGLTGAADEIIDRVIAGHRSAAAEGPVAPVAKRGRERAKRPRRQPG